ncbi:MAG: zinc ribbon domain-containing protein [Candidatus Bathyarchaeota archaeon]|nr:MAG: zinc ribbon domain-containing protein [Candidatus Bathyarchaeota archaeon]
MRRRGFRGGAMMRRGFKGRSRRPYGRFWGRPYRSFMWWRPFWWYPIWWRPLYWMPWTMMMGGFTYLLYDSMAYKVYQNDVEKIERETEKPVRELSEEELVAAMKRLVIQKLEITSADKETISQSGKPVKALSKNDLLAAMKKQGIKKLELTSEDNGAMSHSETSEARYCMYCGNNLHSDAVYCERCGKKIKLR